MKMSAEIDLLNLLISRNQKYKKTKKEISLAKFYLKHLRKQNGKEIRNTRELHTD
jgi:DNA-binding Xre family transcriptional regulator